jgi:outer membrane protein, heavy metal efflux system
VRHRRPELAAIALLPVLAAGPAAAQSPTAPPAAPATTPGGGGPGSGTAALPLAAGAPALTLGEAERRLVENNLAVLAARRGVDAARAQRLVASSLPPPTVSVGNTFAQFNQTSAGLQGARFLSPGNNVVIGLSVLIERGGKRTLRTRLAEEQIGAAEAQVLDALRTQLFQLRQAFLGTLLARANLEVALANRASLDRTESLLRRQVADGAIPEGDLLRFQASRLPFESEVTSNAQAYAAGVAAVATLLASDPAAFAAPPTPPPRPASRGAGGAAAEAPTTVRLILSPVVFDLRGRFDQAPPRLEVGRETLGAAVTSRADVVAAQRQVSAAAANRALAEAGRSRDVTLDTGWGRTKLQQDLPIVPNATVNAYNAFTLNLSVPIFTSRIVEGNIGIAQAQQSQAEALARVALLQARSEFAAAWAGYEQSRALLALYTGGALDRAEEAYRSAEQAYLAGGRTLLDVLDALRTLNATRVSANQARHAVLLALAALEQATGVSGISPRL